MGTVRIPLRRREPELRQGRAGCSLDRHDICTRVVGQARSMYERKLLGRVSIKKPPLAFTGCSL